MSKRKSAFEAKIKSEVAQMIKKAEAKESQRILTLKTGDGALVAFNSFSYDSGVGICNIAQNIAQGPALNQRLANDVRLLRLKAKMFIAPGDNFNCVRVLVVASRGVVTSATTSTFTSQVFSGVTGAAQVAAPVDTLSFDVLFDELVVPFYRPADGNSATQIGVPEVVKIDVSLGNRLVTYNQGNAAFAGKPVWLLLVSDSAAIPNPGCSQVGIRVEFMSA